MAELNNSSTGQWSETDASNTSASPDGWPSGTYLNQVEPIGRATMGAVKRFWDRINGTVTTGGTSSAYTYTPANTSYPTAYVAGEVYRTKIHTDNAAGGITLNINGLGAKSVVMPDGSNPPAGALKGGHFHSFAYDGTNLRSLDAVSGATAWGGITGTIASQSDLVNTRVAAIEYVIDGGGATITTGMKGYLEIPFACTINRSTLLADQSGSIVVNIWKTTYSAFDAGSTHPVVGDKITASAPPTLSTATKAQDSTLTGWTTSISAGDILAFNVDSVTTCQRVTLSLKVTKS